MIDAHLHPGWYINRDGGPEALDLRDAVNRWQIPGQVRGVPRRLAVRHQP